LSFSVSFVVYYVICSFWPTGNQRLIKEMSLGWEEASGDRIVAEDGTEIIEEGKTVRAVGEISDDGIEREEYGVHAKY
jgi:NCS1 family nucleobase:cation symporter-1